VAVAVTLKCVIYQCHQLILLCDVMRISVVHLCVDKVTGKSNVLGERVVSELVSPPQILHGPA